MASAGSVLMKLRAAVAGAGLMGFCHAKNIARAGGEVAVVCDIDEEAARRLAGKCKNSRAAVQIQDALEGSEIDVLHICTPLSAHSELASAALTRGIHVLAEKPMTSDYDETERLYELAAQHRALLCPVHQFLLQRGVRKALADFGRIGRLRHFEATFFSAGGAGRRRSELNEIVAEILPHPLSLMQLFAPGSLRGEGWTVNRSAAGEFHATLTAGETCFSILVSLSSRPTVSAVRLSGTTGTIHLDLFHDFCVIEPGEVSRWRKIIHPFDLATRNFSAASANMARRSFQAETAYPGLRELIRIFYHAIASGGPVPISREDAGEVALVRDHLRKSIPTA